MTQVEYDMIMGLWEAACWDGRDDAVMALFDTYLENPPPGKWRYRTAKQILQRVNDLRYYWNNKNLKWEEENGFVETDGRKPLKRVCGEVEHQAREIDRAAAQTIKS